MNLILKIIARTTLIGIIFLGCSTNRISDKYLIVVMRDIGNKILWSVGDSTTRIMPITFKNNIYTIAFENQIQLNYDSLIPIVKNELTKAKVTQFLIQIKDCQTNDVLLAFVFNSLIDSLSPCIGRNEPNSCYKVEISLEAEPNKHLVLISIILLLLGTAYYFYNKKKYKVIKSEKLENFQSKESEENTDLSNIGKFDFKASSKQLYMEGINVVLTEKESKLLYLLFIEKNQAVTRDKLLTGIWGEEGLIVGTRNIDVLVSKLRKKLLEDEAIKITNVHGVGYKLEVET